MRNRLFSILCLICMTVSISAQEDCSSCKRYTCRGESAGYGSNYSIASSMMAWGVVLFVGIAILVALIEPSTSTAHTHNETN